MVKCRIRSKYVVSDGRRYFGGPGGMCRKPEINELMNGFLSDEVRCW